jgi:hypothetical protein
MVPGKNLSLPNLGGNMTATLEGALYPIYAKDTTFPRPACTAYELITTEQYSQQHMSVTGTHASQGSLSKILYCKINDSTLRACYGTALVAAFRIRSVYVGY